MEELSREEMSQYRYDGFTVKNKRGSLLLRFARSTKKEVIKDLGIARWRVWKQNGDSIVKIRLVEVEK